jgi:hypothetical protein
MMGLMSPMALIIQTFGAPFATAAQFRPAYIVFADMLVASAIFSRNLNRALRCDALEQLRTDRPFAKTYGLPG